MNEKKILLEAAKLIEQPNAWHQGHKYNNIYGQVTRSYENAASYCMYGAVLAVLLRNNVNNMDNKLANILANFHQTFGSGMISYNDKSVRKQSQAVDTLRILSKEIQC